jgi:HEAT repeat protein
VRTPILLLTACLSAYAINPAERMFDTSLTTAQRNDACFALRGAADAPTREAMYRALKLESLRACAATNLRAAGAVEELKQALTDESPEVRAAAARELGSLRQTELLPLLAKAAADPNLLVATNALHGLNQFAGPEVVLYLEPIAQKGGILGIQALGHLDTMKSPAALRVARVLLQHDDVADRVSAMKVLGDSGDATDLPALRAIAASKAEVMVSRRGFGLMPPIDVARAAKATIGQIEARMGVAPGHEPIRKSKNEFPPMASKRNPPGAMPSPDGGANLAFANLEVGLPCSPFKTM